MGDFDDFDEFTSASNDDFGDFEGGTSSPASSALPTLPPFDQDFSSSLASSNASFIADPAAFDFPASEPSEGKSESSEGRTEFSEERIGRDEISEGRSEMPENQNQPMEDFVTVDPKSSSSGSDYGVKDEDYFGDFDSKPALPEESNANLPIQEEPIIAPVSEPSSFEPSFEPPPFEPSSLEQTGLQSREEFTQPAAEEFHEGNQESPNSAQPGPAGDPEFSGFVEGGSSEVVESTPSVDESAVGQVQPENDFGDFGDFGSSSQVQSDHQAPIEDFPQDNGRQVDAFESTPDFHSEVPQPVEANTTLSEDIPHEVTGSQQPPLEEANFDGAQADVSFAGSTHGQFGEDVSMMVHPGDQSINDATFSDFPPNDDGFGNFSASNDNAQFGSFEAFDPTSAAPQESFPNDAEFQPPSLPVEVIADNTQQQWAPEIPTESSEQPQLPEDVTPAPSFSAHSEVSEGFSQFESTPQFQGEVHQEAHIAEEGFGTANSNEASFQQPQESQATWATETTTHFSQEQPPVAQSEVSGFPQSETTFQPESAQGFEPPQISQPEFTQGDGFGDFGSSSGFVAQDGANFQAEPTQGDGFDFQQQQFVPSETVQRDDEFGDFGSSSPGFVAQESAPPAAVPDDFGHFTNSAQPEPVQGYDFQQQQFVQPETVQGDAGFGDFGSSSSGFVPQENVPPAAAVDDFGSFSTTAQTEPTQGFDLQSQQFAQPELAQGDGFGDFGSSSSGFVVQETIPTQAVTDIGSFGNPVSDDFNTFAAPPVDDDSSNIQGDGEFGGFGGFESTSSFVPEPTFQADSGANTFTSFGEPPPMTEVSDGFGDFGSSDQSQQPYQQSAEAFSDFQAPFDASVQAAPSENFGQNFNGGDDFSATAQVTGFDQPQQATSTDFGDFGDFGGVQSSSQDPFSAPAPSFAAAPTVSDDGFGDFGGGQAFAAPPAAAASADDAEFGDFGGFSAGTDFAPAAPAEQGFASGGDFGSFGGASEQNNAGDFGDFGGFTDFGSASFPAAVTPQPTPSDFGDFGDFGPSTVTNDDFGNFDAPTPTPPPSVPPVSGPMFRTESLKLTTPELRTAIASVLEPLFSDSANLADDTDMGGKLEGMLNQSAAWAVYAQTQMQSFSWNTTQIEAKLMGMFGVKRPEEKEKPKSSSSHASVSVVSPSPTSPSPVQHNKAQDSPIENKTFFDTGFGKVEVAPSREPFGAFESTGGDFSFGEAMIPAAAAAAAPVIPPQQSSTTASVFGSDFDFLGFDGPVASLPAAMPASSAQPAFSFATATTTAATASSSVFNDDFFSSFESTPTPAPATHAPVSVSVVQASISVSAGVVHPLVVGLKLSESAKQLVSLLPELNFLRSATFEAPKDPSATVTMSNDLDMFSFD